VLQQLCLKAVAIGKSGGEVKHQSFLLSYIRDKLVAIQQQEHFHRGMRNSLVAIEKRIQREGTTERGRFGSDSGVQIRAGESNARLSKSGLEGAEIANSSCAAGGAEYRSVKGDKLAEREIPHQTRRRYGSRFFAITRAATASKSAAGVASKSRTAAVRPSQDHRCTGQQSYSVGQERSRRSC
jgi:hypothetical protein